MKREVCYLCWNFRKHILQSAGFVSQTKGIYTSREILSVYYEILSVYYENYLQPDMHNSSSQDFWANFVYFLPNFGEKVRNMSHIIWLKIGEIWLNSSSQKIPGLMSYAYPTVSNSSVARCKRFEFLYSASSPYRGIPIRFWEIFENLRVKILNFTKLGNCMNIYCAYF